MIGWKNQRPSHDAKTRSPPRPGTIFIFMAFYLLSINVVVAFEGNARRKLAELRNEEKLNKKMLERLKFREKIKSDALEL